MKNLNDPSSDWQRFGETDPYWAVLTDERFRAGKITASGLSDFFQSGEQHLDAVWRRIEESVAPDFSPRRSLDFGCGVGRVLIPLSRRSPAAVGIDVASSMLDEARRNLQREGVAAELVLGDDQLSRLTGTFDFIHSYIVIQHIPPARGESIVKRLLDRLEPGGVAALHFTTRIPRVQRLKTWAHRFVPFAHTAANLMRGRSASQPYMQAYEYDSDRLLEIIHAAGCRDLHLEPTDHGGVLGIFIYCRKNSRKAAD